MCSSKCLIKNAQDYSCGIKESQHYMSIFFDVWDFIKEFWKLSFSNFMSQDGSVFGKTGHSKYNKGKLKQLPPWNVDKLIDNNPNAKNQYARHSKVTKQESCIENFDKDLYYPAPEGMT